MHNLMVPSQIHFSCISFLSFFAFFFRTAPVAYGNSQASGQTRTAAEAYATATAMPDLR